MTLVHVPDDANGLVAIMGDLLTQNFDRDPARARRVGRGTRAGVVSIRAADIGLSVTIGFTADGIKLTNGGAKSADVKIRADSMTLLEVSAAPLLFGFPDATKAEGRAVLRKLRTKELTVTGLLRHPFLLAKLNRVLSST